MKMFLTCLGLGLCVAGGPTFDQHLIRNDIAEVLGLDANSKLDDSKNNQYTGNMSTHETLGSHDTLPIPTLEEVVLDTQKNLSQLESDVLNESGIPDNTTPLKNINWKNGEAVIDAIDNTGIAHVIRFDSDGIYCNNTFLKPKLGIVSLGIKNIKRDSYAQKFIIQGKLGFVSKQVPMPLENANWLVDQIIQVSTGQRTAKEIAIPGGDGTKLVVQ